MDNNHYIYVWKYSDLINWGVPFYVGQGKCTKGILEKTKCARAYSTHYRVSNSKFINTFDSRCSRCGEIKHKSLFSKNNRSSTGVRSMCKKCELEKRKNKIKN